MINKYSLSTDADLYRSSNEVALTARHSTCSCCGCSVFSTREHARKAMPVRSLSLFEIVVLLLVGYFFVSLDYLPPETNALTRYVCTESERGDERDGARTALLKDMEGRAWKDFDRVVGQVMREAGTRDTENCDRYTAFADHIHPALEVIEPWNGRDRVCLYPGERYQIYDAEIQLEIVYALLAQYGRVHCDPGGRYEVRAGRRGFRLAPVRCYGSAASGDRPIYDFFKGGELDTR